MNKKNRPRFEDPLELFPRGLTKMFSTWLRLTYPFASIGSNLSCHITSRLSRRRACRISLGNSVTLREYAWLNVATEDHTGEPVIVLEDNCFIGFGSMITAKNRIHLESSVAISQSVLIMDHNHEYGDISLPILSQGITEGGRIRIGQGTWIGHGASIICPRGELTIGRNCVIAANSMVMRSIPPYSVVAGYPATIIRQYDPETGTWRIGRNDGRAARKAESAAHGTKTQSNGFALPVDIEITK
jgi:acetyltransferase-like isoleucine patch superfamily enzyme